MNPLTEKIQLDTRRHFLRNCGMGLGAGALAHLLTPEAFALKAPQNPLLPRKPHFSEKAKRVIYIHLTGSPPHLDMWDYKPELVKRTDQDCPDEFVKGKYALIDPNLTGVLNPELDPPKVGGDTINKYIRNSQHIAVNNPLNKPPEVLKDPRKKTHWTGLIIQPQVESIEN